MDRTAKIARRVIIICAVIAGSAALILLESGLYFKTLFTYQNPLEEYGLPKSYTKNGTVPTDVKFEGKTYRYNQNILPVLFIGIDKTEQREMQGIGYCADVQILAAVNRKTGEVKIISIPRDTLTEVPVFALNKELAYTGNMQVTLIHGYAQDMPIRGDLCMAGIANLFYGIPVTRYVSMDIDGITPMTDAIGGVEVTLLDSFKQVSPKLKKGKTVLLEGELAERYVRDRSLKGMSGSDLDRMKRQAQFASAFLSTLKTVIKDDPTKLAALIGALKAHIETNFTFPEAVSLAFSLRNAKIDIENIKTVPGESIEDPKKLYVSYQPDENGLKRLVLETFFEEAPEDTNTLED